MLGPDNASSDSCSCRYHKCSVLLRNPTTCIAIMQGCCLGSFHAQDRQLQIAGWLRGVLDKCSGKQSQRIRQRSVHRNVLDF